MINMQKDEKRIIKIKISASDNSKFEIEKADYEVYKSENALKFQDSGECNVDETVISILFNPKESGVYVIKLIIKIGIETVVKKIQVNVDK